MYRKQDHEQLKFEDFYLPFSGKLRADNRWLRLAHEIPWAELGGEYVSLSSDQKGAPAVISSSSKNEARGEKSEQEGLLMMYILQLFL